jgi:hypothetical protein
VTCMLHCCGCPAPILTFPAHTKSSVLCKGATASEINWCALESSIPPQTGMLHTYLHDLLTVPRTLAADKL